MPTPAEAMRLTEEFDALFATKTGYDQLKIYTIPALANLIAQCSQRMVLDSA